MNYRSTGPTPADFRRIWNELIGIQTDPNEAMQRRDREGAPWVPINSMYCNIETPNEVMQRKDREGAPWVPINPASVSIVSPPGYDERRLARAFEKTMRIRDDCGWPGSFLR